MGPLCSSLEGEPGLWACKASLSHGHCGNKDYGLMGFVRSAVHHPVRLGLDHGHRRPGLREHAVHFGLVCSIQRWSCPTWLHACM